jgi:hypothetical protein
MTEGTNSRNDLRTYAISYKHNDTYPSVTDQKGMG